MILPFLAISIILAYLIGSIPVAYLFGRWLKKLDIREHGSGNMGATNAFRVLGRGPGWTVLALDIIKGLIPVTLVANAFGLQDSLSLVLIGLAAVAGHNWTVFLGFKGGKGIATSLGVLIGLAVQIPALRTVLGIVLIVWLVFFLSSGYVSLASVAAAVFLPVLMVVYDAPFAITVMAIVLCIFIVLRHRSNIKRLSMGQESRAFRPSFKKFFK